MRLQDLIHQRKEEIGRARGRPLTYNEMVERAAAANYPISRSMLHHLADQEWPNMPTTDKIRGIAAAIEVSPDEIVLAAAESLGLQTEVIEIDPNVRAMLAMLGRRTPEQQQVLRDVIRSVTMAMDAAAGAASGGGPDRPDGDEPDTPEPKI